MHKQTKGTDGVGIHYKAVYSKLEAEKTAASCSLSADLNVGKCHMLCNILIMFAKEQTAVDFKELYTQFLALP